MAKDKKKEAAAEEEVKTEETVTQEAPSKEAELEKELAAAKEAHIRTLAEYDNYRKRTAKEKEGIYGDAKADCMKSLLGVLDNFDRAASNKNCSFEDYQKGIDLIFNQFGEILKKLGVESYGERGDEFDPNIHNAVMHTEEEGVEENTITQVFQKGFKMGEKVIRFAMVQVAN